MSYYYEDVQINIPTDEYEGHPIFPGTEALAVVCALSAYKPGAVFVHSAHDTT